MIGAADAARLIARGVPASVIERINRAIADLRPPPMERPTDREARALRRAVARFASIGHVRRGILTGAAMREHLAPTPHRYVKATARVTYDITVAAKIAPDLQPEILRAALRPLGWRDSGVHVLLSRLRRGR
jgi:hypothetical protein